MKMGPGLQRIRREMNLLCIDEGVMAGILQSGAGGRKTSLLVK